jgi:hypothetical protein
MPLGSQGTQVFKRIPPTAVTAGSPLTVWTPSTGKRFRLLGYSLGATVAAAQCFFLDVSAATGIATPVLAIGGPPANSPSLGDGYLSSGPDQALRIDVSASSTVAGFVWGVED